MGSKRKSIIATTAIKEKKYQSLTNYLLLYLILNYNLLANRDIKT